MFQNLIIVIVYCLFGGRWIFLSMVLSIFLIVYVWIVLRVNVFFIIVGLLERYIQGVLVYFVVFQILSMLRFTKMFFIFEELCEIFLDEKDRDLREELERERDKNLCVVC